MAKDPRFNFYVDNWIGGVEGFTLEQEGAYLSLIIMQSKIGRFSEQQAFDKLMQKTRGNAAACAGLWKFLMPKFETDGHIFWSARLEKEMSKSQLHSKKQSERAKKRWEENGINSGNAAAYAPHMPDNRSGNGNRISNEEKGVQGEKQLEEKLSDAFDEIMLESIRSTFPKHDIKNELSIFTLKVRGSPEKYMHHEVMGLRQAFIYQLKNSTSTNGNGTNNSRGQAKSNVRRADAILEEGKDFGTL
jgi:hypothetical protein